ncbi:hypothetical protein [Caldalkalibacillus mannanilyticus]|uniref:hypothetical protein n=1 Tax=Caldalkalibacillus mannanilyticus TaxID=1418 RepID=UPI00046A1718|nr:hypothetical protein [Caldalkalibacillus mannanilyticus]
MIVLGSERMEKKKSLEENVEAVFQYLKENHLLIVDEDHIPLMEEVIIQKLAAEESPQFITRSIQEVESETIQSVIEFIDQAEKNIKELADENNKAKIFQAFSDIVETFVELQSLTEYFDVAFPSEEKIKELSKKGLAQMENQNESYLLDLLEYECLPILEELRDQLAERNVN